MWATFLLAAASMCVTNPWVILQRQPLTNKRPGFGYIDKTMTRTALDCARRCSWYGECRSLFYVRNTGECQTHRAVYTPASTGLVDEISAVYYEIEAVSPKPTEEQYTTTPTTTIVSSTPQTTTTTSLPSTTQTTTTTTLPSTTQTTSATTSLPSTTQTASTTTLSSTSQTPKTSTLSSTSQTSATTTVSSTSLIPTATTTTTVCSSSSDLVAGLYADQMTSSSAHTTYLASEARLDNPSYYWKPKNNDGSPWIQIDFQNSAIITTIVTQGGLQNEWVETYKVEVSDDCTAFSYVTSGNNQTFTGNFDMHTHVSHQFDNPVQTRCVRIMPYATANGVTALRLGLIGCNTITSTPSPPVCPGTNYTQSDNQTFSFRLYFDKLRTFSDAKTKCESDGGYLFEILTVEKMNFARQLVLCPDYSSSYFWIDGKYNGTTSVYETSNGKPLPLTQGTFFYTDKPNSNKVGWCIWFDPNMNHLLDDTDCQWSAYMICEKP